MSRFTTLALGLSALLVSVAAANAATAKKPMHHMHAPKASHARTVAAKAAPSADRSADSLNAQSLARSQPAQ